MFFNFFQPVSSRSPLPKKIPSGNRTGIWGNAFCVYKTWSTNVTMARIPINRVEGGGQPPSSHTTWHAGPHQAVPKS